MVENSLKLGIMENFDRKKHWEEVYQTKDLTEVSWYQPTPETSLHFINELKLSKTANIIDIGGGDSFLVDHLLELGYQNVTVLDISAAAIQRAKKRLGKRADHVKWIVSDAANFQPTEAYDCWHDRATFHFLTDNQEISSYVETAYNHIRPTGFMVIGTFSLQGPKKCSGLDVKQYSEHSMTERFKHEFEKIKCITVDHPTPSGSIQNFVFCSFKRK